MNYNTLRNKPTINYRELIGDSTVSEVGGVTEEEFNDLLDTDLASYYTKAQIDELFARSYVFREKSGSIVTFDCPSSVNGIDKVVNEIVAVQSGTGDPSPTNIRPFTGWSAVNRYRTGKNLFDASSVTIANITFNTSSGETTRSGFRYNLPAGTYSAKCFDETVQSYVYISIQDSNGNYIERKSLSITGEGGWRDVSFTLNKGDYIIVYEGGANILLTSTHMLCIQTDTVESYTAYNGQTYTTTLKDGQGNPLTCYGGELSNENGVQSLTNTVGFDDLSQLVWETPYTGTTNKTMRTTLSDFYPQLGVNNDNMLAEQYLRIGGVTGIAQLTNPDSLSVGMRTYRASTATEESRNKNLYLILPINETPAGKLIYPLNETIQISQDNLTISSSAGTNNIWCNSGDITVRALDKIIQG